VTKTDGADVRNSRIGGDRRTELIGVAEELFMQNGYDNVSIRDIVRGTDSSGSPGLFYYYFGSKKEIYDAVIDKIVADVMRSRHEIFAVFRANPSLQAGDVFWRSLMEDARRVRALAAETVDTGQVADVLRRLAVLETPRLRAMVLGLLNHPGNIRLGGLVDKAHSRQFVDFIVAGVNGVVASEGSSDDLEETVGYLRRMVMMLFLSPAVVGE
jgi:AcrR family transcriptional regulator